MTRHGKSAGRRQLWTPQTDGGAGRIGCTSQRRGGRGSVQWKGVEPFEVEDRVPDEGEIEWAVKRLRNNRTGGPSRMRATALVAIFDKVGLMTNVGKTVGMVYHPCQAGAVNRTEEAYGQRITG